MWPYAIAILLFLFAWQVLTIWMMEGGKSANRPTMPRKCAQDARSGADTLSPDDPTEKRYQRDRGQI